MVCVDREAKLTPVLRIAPDDKTLLVSLQPLFGLDALLSAR